MRFDFFASGTTVGRPGEGSGSAASWSAYQSGSIQTSATHSALGGGRTASADGRVGRGRLDGLVAPAAASRW